MNRPDRVGAHRGWEILERLRGGVPAPAGADTARAARLSATQKTLLAARQLHGQPTVGNVARSWEVSGPLNAAALERAWRRLVARHDALRMSVVKEDGETRPRFLSAIDVALPCEPAPGGDRARRLEAIDAAIGRLSLEELPLDEDRLWRARLFELDAETHVLAVVMDHLICDEWSWKILPRDLLRLYRAEIEGGETGLPPAPSLERLLQNEPKEAPADPPHAAPVAEIDWPGGDPSAPEGLAARREEAVRRLEAEEFAALRQLARARSCTPFTVFLAAYQFLLATCCDQSEVPVSVSAASRTRLSARNAIGPLVRDVEVAADLSAHRRFSDLLAATAEGFAAAQAREDDAVHLGRAVISYYNAPEPPTEASRLRLARRPDPRRDQSANLALGLQPRAGGVDATFGGQRRHFDRAALASLADCYLRILRQVIADPDAALEDIALVAPAEAQRLARRSIHRAPLDGHGDLPARFRRIARAHAGEAALETPGRRWTYAELDRETDALAHWLRGQGLAAGDRLAVRLPRGAAVFRAWLAALKAGLVVVPIDSELPASRMRTMLAEAECAAMVGRNAEDREAAGEARILILPEEADPAAAPRNAGEGDPTSDAFVMFTSGTTGRPKSIPVSHLGIIRLSEGETALPVGPGDRMIQLASAGFDGSFIEVWGAWLRGAALVLCEKHILAEGGLEAEFRRLAPTAAFLTTSLFHLVVDADPAVLRPLRLLAIGGEAASGSHCRRALEANPSLRLRNVYGPTENTSLTTSFEIGSDVGPNPPIGRPLPNNAAFVLSSRLQPVPDGFAGELLIGGPGLSRGYENQPDLAAERFRKIAARRLGAGEEGALRLYRTGDRARWNALGELEYLGRRDSQFKLHGHRVEPSEIENALMEHPGVGRAAVRPERRPGAAQATGIVAYHEAPRPNPPTERELRAFLAARLPRPMLPTRHVRLAAIPLTPNGKLDARALPQAPQAAPAAGKGADDPAAEIWRGILDLPAVPEDGDFYALGGTSLSLVQMILEVERRTGAEIDFGAFSSDPTLRRLRLLLALSPSAAARGCGRLRVLREGDAALAPLVLAPSQTGQTAWALDVLAELPSRNSVWALTFGPAEASAPGAYERLLAEMLEELAGRAEGPVALAGYSFGAGMAGHLAGRAAARGLEVEKLIVMDGASLPARPAAHDEADARLAALMAGFFACPILPIEAECHVFSTERRFPFTGASHGAGWALLTRGRVAEHSFDTHHLLLTRPPFAGRVAQRLAAILAGEAKPDRVREGHLDPAVLAAMNEARRLIGAGEEARAEAIELLSGQPPAAGVDWAGPLLVQLCRLAGDEERIRRLARRDRPASQVLLDQLARETGPGRLRRLRRCHAASGEEHSGALPLVALLARRGASAEAAAIAADLAASPRLAVEAALAEAVIAAFDADPAAVCERMETALSDPQASQTHLLWSAMFLAHRGAHEGAFRLLDAQRGRFPDAAQRARARIAAIAEAGAPLRRAS